MSKAACAGVVLALLATACPKAPPPILDLPGAGKDEAPAAFDGAPNGTVDADTHKADLEAFDGVEDLADGLGPIYNAQSCRECHQNPFSGGGSQISELRVGHRDASGKFVAPSIPIAGGAAVVSGRTLVNDRAICPNGTFPDVELQERVPPGEDVRTFRLSISLFGDGFVEAVADETLKSIAAWQCRATGGRVCGRTIAVPVLEAPGKYAVGRFGWKAQQASLLSFSADAYLNEMGITSRLLSEEFTTLCDTAADPEDKPGKDGLADVDLFARFMRALKAPPRDRKLAATPEAEKGSKLFTTVGCAVCHLPTLVTAPAGTMLLGGAYRVPAELGEKTFHPYGDFLLHDVGTGDGIATAVLEHHGKRYMSMQPEFDVTTRLLRTPPLWGLRTRSRLMHDGASTTALDAILRHDAEASDARRLFERLSAEEREQVLTFLRSL